MKDPSQIELQKAKIHRLIMNRDTLEGHTKPTLEIFCTWGKLISKYDKQLFVSAIP